MIERTLNYIRYRLIELMMPTERHIVISKYNLEEVSKNNTSRMVKYVWDNNFVGNRHVVI